jgi:hypothetical protein
MFFDGIDNGDVDDDEAEEKSLGNGMDIGSGRLIIELVERDTALVGATGADGAVGA